VRRNPPYFGKHFQHQGAAANHAFELINVQQFQVEAKGLLPPGAFREQTCNSIAELLNIERFG